MNNEMDALALAGMGVGMTILIVILVIWEAIWKAIAMWKAARNGHTAWYVCLLIFNTAGILPIIYIFAFAKKQQPTPVSES